MLSNIRIAIVLLYRFGLIEVLLLIKTASKRAGSIPTLVLSYRCLDGDIVELSVR